MGNKRNMFYLKQCLGLGMMREMGAAYTDFIFITLHWQQNHLSFLESHFHLSAFLMFLLVLSAPPVIPVFLNFDENKLVASSTRESFGHQTPRPLFLSKGCDAG